MASNAASHDEEVEIDAHVVVVGGGPAGLISALLFARAGASVVVLESHADFLRDFRGDTVHPSTLALFQELGCLEEFLALPHDRAEDLSATFADLEPKPPTLRLADFSRLAGSAGVPCPYVAMMPQHVLLDWLDRKAAAYGPARYRLIRNARVTGLLYEDPSRPDTSRVVGVRATLDNASAAGGGGGGGKQQQQQQPPKQLIARASALVVAADGRRSALRAAAALPPAVYPGGAPPMDVLWFRVPRDPAADPSPGRTQGFVTRDAFLVSIFRGEYYQMGLVVPKGGADAVRRAGLPAFARRVSGAVPYFTPERVEAAVPRFFGGASDEDGAGDNNSKAYAPRDVHLLSVRVDRLTKWWRSGLICIGDAAHAMSPIGGLGINMAVQDAVALSNQLAAKVAASGGAPVADADLAAVQRRRELPTRLTQGLQVLIQRRVIRRVVGGGDETAATATTPLAPPRALRLFQRFPALQWLPARLIGVGFRPEHIRCPEAPA